jgi:enoyl-CoA hydratase/carnithine racemase
VVYVLTYSVSTDWPLENVACISFCDRDRRNQICWAAIDELGEQLRLARERGARVVVLASALEDHWFEHAWLQDLIDGVEGAEQSGSGRGWLCVLKELAHESVISIAAISGNCSGGGAEIGWACDLRIAEEQSFFSQPEIAMGLTTGIGGSCRLARLAGRGVATEMVLTGEPVSAARLYQLGAVTRLVERGQALSASLKLAEALTKKSSDALAGLKKVLAVSDNEPLASALKNEQKVFQAIVSSKEALSGMKQVQKQYGLGILNTGAEMYTPTEVALIRNHLLDSYSRYAQGLDSQNWEMVRACFADEILIDYGELSISSGPPEVPRRADDWMASLQRVINGFDVTRHAITNHRMHIDESGGVSCRAYLSADHVIYPDSEARVISAEDVVTVVGEYNNYYEQIEGLWKIVKSELKVDWTIGHGDLLEVAVERAEGRSES